MFSSLSRLITLFFILILMGIGSLIYIIHYYNEGLPDYRQLAKYHPPLVTRFYAADGKLLEEYSKEHRIFTNIDNIPKQVINAFLAAEDKHFYDHPGIDISGLLRAIIHNIYNIGHNKTLVGGSTITQQVVKNLLLTNEKSISRKIKEAILSFRISKVYSKDQILELYLNQIYLGNGSYGVASATVNYFNKTLDELTIEEAALLAALPKAPNNYDPKQNYKKSLSRRNWVLNRMAEEHLITPQEAQKAISMPINIKSRDKNYTTTANTFAESVRRRIIDMYGEQTLYEGGLTVFTSLDPKLQKLAEQAFNNGLIKYDKKQGYRGAITNIGLSENLLQELKKIKMHFTLPKPWELAVVIGTQRDKILIKLNNDKDSYIPITEILWARPNLTDTKQLLKKGDVILVEAIKNKGQALYTLRQIPEVNGGFVVMNPNDGRVLAMVGGNQFDHSQFNRVTQALRQPGSAFKPFVYLAAIENGFSPNSIIVDAPIEIDQGPGLPLWKPKNYSGDFIGPITLRKALEKSRNTVTVRLALELGIKKIMEVTKKFGINQNPEPNFSIVLGATETTLLKLVNAYAMIANGGVKVIPNLIDRIQDRNGITIFRNIKKQCASCIIHQETDIASIIPPEVTEEKDMVIDPRTAYQMISLLEGTVQRGTARLANHLGKSIAGKTGTSNDSKDVWFVGFSPNLVVGTYIGYDSPRSLGKKETGATLALPIFNDFMSKALRGTSRANFQLPKGINLLQVDYDTGKPINNMLELDNKNNIIWEAFKNDVEPYYDINTEIKLIKEDQIDDSFEYKGGIGDIY